MPTLQFKGKQLVQNHHLVVPFHELIPVKAKSVTDKVSLHDNVIIHGDNLAALKALLPTHHGKIKCIYIDPPYNTGNEGWVYNDNVNDPMIKEWLGKVVDKEDLTRHDKWLCMMWPRLRLLKDLLAENGIIFISIDDNEVHHLRCMMDEIFGEENFIGFPVWQKKYGPANDAKGMSSTHEFILCYGKNIVCWKPGLIERNEEQLSAFKNLDNDSRGKWRASDLSARTFSESGNYVIKGPTGKEFLPPNSRSWIVNEKRFFELLNDNRIIFGADGQGRPMQKTFLSEVKAGITPETWWDREIAGDNKTARYEIKDIFPENIFDTPKPTKLIALVLTIADTKDSDIILDSFAGSGTTAHAVLALNKEDGGNRKFVLIETLDYADTITAERVRRVIKGVPNARDEALKEGLSGTFSYFELGKPIEIQTILDGTNLPQYRELARYVFFMATGEQWNEKELMIDKNYIGESRNYHVYLFYKPDIEYLKNTALTLNQAEELPEWKAGDKRRLIFAPTKYLDQDYLDRFGIDFARLPYEIYQLAGDKKKAET